MILIVSSVAALVWQLMKAYTLSILTKLASEDSGHPIIEKEIVEWANSKVRIYMKLFILYFFFKLLYFIVLEFRCRDKNATCGKKSLFFSNYFSHTSTLLNMTLIFSKEIVHIMVTL